MFPIATRRCLYITSFLSWCPSKISLPHILHGVPRPWYSVSDGDYVHGEMSFTIVGTAPPTLTCTTPPHWMGLVRTKGRTKANRRVGGCPAMRKTQERSPREEQLVKIAAQHHNERQLSIVICQFWVICAVNNGQRQHLLELVFSDLIDFWFHCHYNSYFYLVIFISSDMT